MFMFCSINLESRLDVKLGLRKKEFIPQNEGINDLSPATVTPGTNSQRAHLAFLKSELPGMPVRHVDP
jgi:hypothetical protein